MSTISVSLQSPRNASKKDKPAEEGGQQVCIICMRCAAVADEITQAKKKNGKQRKAAVNASQASKVSDRVMRLFGGLRIGFYP